MRPIAQASHPAGTPLPADVYQSPRPVVLRGFVNHWPAVTECLTAEAAARYLEPFWCDRPLTVYVGDKYIRGRFFYNEGFTGFNFRSGTATLRQVLEKLDDPQRGDTNHSIYVGSTPVDQWLKGFRELNDVELPASDALASFWLGNRTNISAHFDFPDNLACVVAGTRQFTLFPPEQLENLYVGPIDRTPSGQAISLVDFDNPDYRRFPKFAKAMQAAQIATLKPGDALFIPSMWWHQVRSLDAFNLLVNYWWCASPTWMGAPSAALKHALLALRDLPEHQRKVWQNLFNYYVFDAREDNFEHIPKPGRGILDPLDKENAQSIRTDLFNRFKG